jgi:hypothetical protein
LSVADQTSRAFRVTVVLSGGEADRETLMTLALMHSDIGSEVVGLFLEDSDLLRIAGLPWSHEVSRFSPKARPLEVSEIERQMRAQATRARRALQETAERAGLRWSFRTVRGQLAAAMQSASEGDLLLLSASKRPAATAAEVRALLRGTRSGNRKTKAIAVVFAGSEHSARSLAAATRLSKSGSRPLDILVPPTALAAVEAQRARDEVPYMDRDTRVVAVPSLETDDFIRALRNRHPALLVIDANEAFAEGPRLASLRRNAGCPLLVIR